MDTSNNIDKGKLVINITNSGTSVPIKNATIEIASTGEPDRIIETIETDASGQTSEIELNAPPLEFSMAPSDNQPYSEYNIKIKATNYEEQFISGVQILSGQLGIQQIGLKLDPNQQNIFNPTVIPGHTLWEFYPPKIAEDEIKPMNESGEIVLDKVVIPETIVVHDGAPTDTTAPNYYIPYLDYIKNVASCEIYSTWPESTLEANILAIMSITLNRVYTEWYRNKGYNFTITSSTAFDQKWIKDKTIYESISQVVNRLFNNYLARPNVKQPIFTQYCDGKRVTCPNWMSQWGSKSLGDQGRSSIDILRNYYGNSIYINTAEIVSGIVSSFPGNLTIGSSGPKVTQLQEQLNRIAKNYPLIPTITVDGIFGEETANSVKVFQGIFGLPKSGIVDYPTWYKVSQLYVAVTKIAEG